MYEAVRPYPAGDATAARFARVAGAYGYDGVVLRRSPDDDAQGGGAGDEPTASPSGPADSDAAPSDVVPAIEVDAADRDRLARLLRERREDVPVIVARAADGAASRFAAERERVDVLLPTPGATPDHATIGTAAANGVRIGVDLGPVLRGDGGSRVRALGHLRTLVTDLRDRDAPHVVTGTPASHLALRAPRDIAALGAALDVSADWVRDGLAEWGRIIRRNRERAAPPPGEPGVRIEGSESGGDRAGSAGEVTQGSADPSSDTPAAGDGGDP